MRWGVDSLSLEKQWPRAVSKMSLGRLMDWLLAVLRPRVWNLRARSNGLPSFLLLRLGFKGQNMPQWWRVPLLWLLHLIPRFVRFETDHQDILCGGEHLTTDTVCWRSRGQECGCQSKVCWGHWCCVSDNFLGRCDRGICVRLCRH